MSDNVDSDDCDIPELDEVILKQIEGFKPIMKLKNAINTEDFEKDGAIIEINEDKSDEPKIDISKYNPMDFLVDDEMEEYTPLENDQFVDITGDGGVLKCIIKHGFGPVVPPESLCRVHYSAYLQNELEPFDSTRSRNAHSMIQIGKNGNGLVGLQVGISTMKQGEEAKLVLRSDYAFGKYGCPPRIPPNSVVVFEVELVSFVEQYYEDEDEDFQNSKAWEKIVKKLEPLHKEANDLYLHNNYKRALAKYGKAFRIAESALLFSPKDEQQMNDFCVKMFLNVALCSSKLGRYEYTISMCKKVLSIQPNNLKALFRIGQAFRLKSKFKKAKEFLLQAKALSPLNSDICNELMALRNDIINYENSMKKMCQAMFNSQEKDTQCKGEKNEKVKEFSDDLKEIDNSLSEMLREKIKNFVESENKTPLVLPNAYLDTEITAIQKVSDEFNLKCDIQKHRITISKN